MIVCAFCLQPVHTPKTKRCPFCLEVTSVAAVPILHAARQIISDSYPQKGNIPQKDWLAPAPQNATYPTYLAAQGSLYYLLRQQKSVRVDWATPEPSATSYALPIGECQVSSNRIESPASELHSLNAELPMPVLGVITDQNQAETSGYSLFDLYDRGNKEEVQDEAVASVNKLPENNVRARRVVRILGDTPDPEDYLLWHYKPPKENLPIAKTPILIRAKVDEVWDITDELIEEAMVNSDSQWKNKEAVNREEVKAVAFPAIVTDTTPTDVEGRTQRPYLIKSSPEEIVDVELEDEDWTKYQKPQPLVGLGGLIKNFRVGFEGLFVRPKQKSA